MLILRRVVYEFLFALDPAAIAQLRIGLRVRLAVESLGYDVCIQDERAENLSRKERRLWLNASR